MTTNFIMKIEGEWKKCIFPKDLPEGTKLTSADQLLVSPSEEEDAILSAKYNEYKTAIIADLKENQSYSFKAASAFIKESKVFLSIKRNIITTEV